MNKLEQFIVAYNKHLLEHGEKPTGTTQQRWAWYSKLMESLTGEWHDIDDAPELTDEWFEKADVYKNGKLIKKGKK